VFKSIAHKLKRIWTILKLDQAARGNHADILNNQDSNW